MNADGSQQSRLTNNLASDLWPKWSPDGTRITFHSMRDDKLAVHVMNPDGSQQVRMADPNSGNLGPAWQPKAERVVVLLPTSTPLPTAMAVPPTPLGLFVTNLRLDPPSLPPAQDVNFFVTFFNGTGNPARYRWKVLIYKPDNTRNSFGETSAVLPDLPLGSSEQKVGTWRITAGACGDYVAWVAWVDEGNRLVSFTQTNGQIYELPFATCR